MVPLRRQRNEPNISLLKSIQPGYILLVYINVANNHHRDLFMECFTLLLV